MMPDPRHGEWSTPRWVIEAAERIIGNCFALDVAANQDNWQCCRFYGPGSKIGEDGLVAHWNLGPIWLNPPYANIQPWADRAIIEHSLRGTLTIALLLPARQTKYCYDLRNAGADWWELGRVRFGGQKSPGTCDSLLYILHAPMSGVKRYGGLRGTIREP